MLLNRVVAVRPGEARATLWSFGYFFCLLAAYYVLRPLRDEMGIAGGVRNLHWLFTATFVVMLAAVPIFGAVVARLPRCQDACACPGGTHVPIRDATRTIGADLDGQTRA